MVLARDCIMEEGGGGIALGKTKVCDVSGVSGHTSTDLMLTRSQLLLQQRSVVIAKQ